MGVYLDYCVGVHGAEISVVVFLAYDGAVVLLSDFAVFEFESYVRGLWGYCVGSDCEGFGLGYVLGCVYFGLEAFFEGFDACVVSYDFDYIAGEEAAVAAWDVVSEVAAFDGGDVYS